MYARVSTYQETSEGIEIARERAADVIEKAKALPGFQGLYYLVDRSTGKALSVTLWETEAAMLGSVESANKIRTEEAGATGAQILSVEHFEVETAALN